MLQRRKGGFGGIPGGGRGGGMGLAGLILLGVGSWAISNSLFNGMLSMHWSTDDLNLTLCLVDGGHRAIKYSRVSGVKKEIYNEGMTSRPMEHTRSELTLRELV